MVSNILGSISILGYIACQFAFFNYPKEYAAQWSLASSAYLIVAAICFK